MLLDWRHNAIAGLNGEAGAIVILPFSLKSKTLNMLRSGYRHLWFYVAIRNWLLFLDLNTFWETTRNSMYFNLP